MPARNFARALLLGACIAGAPVAGAAAPGDARRLQVREGSLSAALEQVARQTGAEILYDPRIVQGRGSAGVRGRMSADAALARLLSGTGIGYRRTAGGAFVLFAQLREALPVEDAPIPEILVVGRRSQNADIRRTPNDIQPYVVSARSEIENAHPDNVEEFVRSRISADAQIVTPAQDISSRPASVESEIDLRGLGSTRTLVLIDGRRMPSLPTPQFDFGQADLNAIPLSAIERIETLTGTAGGIYGPGAIGGVVNVVLRRDYRGADVHLVSGLSDRGDAWRFGIEARIGFTPDGGQTDVMLFAARTTVTPIRAGRRDYMLRAMQGQFATDPAAYADLGNSSNAVIVFSQEGNLTFDPAFGGGALGATYTYLPIGFSGTPAERTALLTANAGKLPLDLSRDFGGTEGQILSTPTITSGILNVRRRFGPSFEAFIDLLYFRDTGRYRGSVNVPLETTPANAANNPFQQSITFRFPQSAQSPMSRREIDARRGTIGLLADLGGSWRAAADVTVGSSRTSLISKAQFPTGAFLTALRLGTLGADGRPVVDPLGDWERIRAVSAAMLTPARLDVSQVNRSSVGALRIAGPLLQLPGGPLIATLLVERRREHIPASSFTLATDADSVEVPLPMRTQTIAAGYVELRAPVGAADAAFFPLRGLEFQLAVRYDRVRTLIPNDATPTRPSNDRLTGVNNGEPTFTVGGRVLPLPGLMLRASVATGELPPTIEQLATNITTYGSDQLGTSDPLRGNRRLGAEGPVILLQRGANDIMAERATTLSAGIVVNPAGRSGPRLSIDYSRIDRGREVTFFTTGLAELLADADAFPGRVERAPLTEEDLALGFAAGRLLQIDMRAFNSGRTIVESVDAQLDWSLPAGDTEQLRLYGGATWYPSLRRRGSPSAAWVEHVGYYDGPLAWRGNLGLEWRSGPTLIGLYGQYFDSYRDIYTVDGLANRNPYILPFQGAARISSQAYVDLTVRRTFEIRGAGPLNLIDVNFGIQNLFDSRPSLVLSPYAQGYSYYGDPRRRRVELAVSAGF